MNHELVEFNEDPQSLSILIKIKAGRFIFSGRSTLHMSTKKICTHNLINTISHVHKRV